MISQEEAFPAAEVDFRVVAVDFQVVETEVVSQVPEVAAEDADKGDR